MKDGNGHYLRHLIFIFVVVLIAAYVFFAFILPAILAAVG